MGSGGRQWLTGRVWGGAVGELGGGGCKKATCLRTEKTTGRGEGGWGDEISLQTRKKMMRLGGGLLRSVRGA